MPKSSESPPSEWQSLALIEDCGNPKGYLGFFRIENLECAGRARGNCVFGSARMANADIQSAIGTALRRANSKTGLQLLTRSANIGVRFWRLTFAGSAFPDSGAKEPTLGTLLNQSV